MGTMEQARTTAANGASGGDEAISARPVKRAFDIVFGLAVLLAALPLMAVVAVLVRWRLGSPVLFRQERMGLGNRPFTMTKFRTMTDARGPDGALLPDGARTPPLGHLLRRFRLDEFPEVLNVIRGDMSVVGPRPLPVSFFPDPVDLERRRHRVRPGLTGWAQVNGGIRLLYREKVALDAWYEAHQSLWLDLRILALTVAVILRSERRDDQAIAEALAFAAPLEPPGGLIAPPGADDD